DTSVPADKMDASMFNQTLIGRGPIQVTDRANYLRTLAYMEKRADNLQGELDKVPEDKPALKEYLKAQIDVIREAITAIEADPTAAANPKYAFLFSAAFMHSNPMLQAAAGFGPSEDFTKPVGFSGGFKDPRAPEKAKAYAKAYEILVQRNWFYKTF